MSAVGGRRFPTFPWRRETSVTRDFWVIEDGGVVVAAVYEVGSFERIWSFYHLVEGGWVHLVKFGRLGVHIAGIRPRFAEILGFLHDVDLSNGVFLVVEGGAGRMWWLFYVHLRFGGYLLLFAFQALHSTMEHEERAWDLGDEMDESSIFGPVQQRYDI
jgi:hypothetical protein